MATTELTAKQKREAKPSDHAPWLYGRNTRSSTHKTVRTLLFIATAALLVTSALEVAYLARTIPFMNQPDREFYSYLPPGELSRPFYSRPAEWNRTPAVISTIAGSLCLAMIAVPGLFLVVARAMDPAGRTEKMKMVPLALWVSLASGASGVALAALIVTARAFNASNQLRFNAVEQDQLGLIPWPYGYWLPEVWYSQLASGYRIYVPDFQLSRQASDSRVWRVTLIPMFIFSLLTPLLGVAELLLARYKVQARGPIDAKEATSKIEEQSS